ncbi:hypothetical protein AGMMS4957_17760 [Bacteroidia bacterium]|nr:hypothetical protein AGMMS4957_17760 [Bacteroidia bacterium]
MKKIILFAVACTAFIFTSCDNELDNWNSATYEYAGRFVVAATCQEFPGKSAIIEKGNEIYLYNTASNITNEIWLDDVSGKFPLKSKFSLTGNASGFSAAAAGENVNSRVFIYNATYGEYILFSPSNADDFPVATAAGQTNDGIQEYTRATLQEGKIQPKAATSIGGNVTDGIYLKLTLHTDKVQFQSYLLPAADWETPGVAEYGWELVPNSKTVDVSKDEHWTIAGYRYTGYPEDL